YVGVGVPRHSHSFPTRRSSDLRAKRGDDVVASRRGPSEAAGGARRTVRGQGGRRGPAGRRPTIHDVARDAGVSIGTVSRVVNERGGVRQVTRERVLASIARLGYRPDRAARELSVRRPVTIGLSTAYGHRRLIPFFVLFLEHLLDELATSGLRLRDVPAGEDGLPTEPADAYILLGAHADDPRLAALERQGVPFVLVGHREGVRSVAADDVAGGRVAGEHLTGLGHRDVVHVTGDERSQIFADRLAGLRQALAAAGAPPPTVLTCEDPSALGAYRALRAHLEGEGAGFSAVLAAPDEMAVGCVAALGDAGRAGPRDVSVVGFDDMPEVGESLTPVRQDIAEVARVAVELLHEGLRGASVRDVRVPVRLVARGTTAERR